MKRIAMLCGATIVVLGVLLLGVLSANAQSGTPALKSTPQQILSHVTKVKGLRSVGSFSPAPSDALCRVLLGSPCYSPQQIRKAYGLTPILAAGNTGVGQTIIIVDSYGSPTIAQDLKSFDAGYGLPDPPSFTVLSPLGTVPFNPNDSTIVGWAAETTLDVEWAHAMAPGASIVLMTSPVAETEGVQGLPQFLSLEQYAVNHHLGNIISQSWAATENTLFTTAGQKVIADFEAFYENAARQGVTVLAAAGDDGSANVELDGVTYYSFPTVNFPASSPLVTAVGGTTLYATESGTYQFEISWLDGGGGVSQVFAEPDYQYLLPPSTQQTLAGYRGVPDVAYNADPNTSILIYLSFFGPSYAGYYGIGGTSEGSPQWAGIIADANQMAGHPLGFLNPKLYAIGAAGSQSAFFHDITFGSNAADGPTVPGYLATPGWDFTTGWGTPNLGGIIDQLVR